MKTEKLSDDIEIFTSAGHGFGTDAFLLAYFSEYKKNDIVCDLGTGCGIIPMLMSVKMPPEKIYAVDISFQAIRQLELSIKKNNLTNIEAVRADLRELWDGAPLGKISLLICNPPYKAINSGIKSAGEAKCIARHEVMCNITDVCAAAGRLLKFGGRICMCNRPERLGDVITAMKVHNIEPKRLRFISKNAKSAPWLFLIEGKKGSKPFMKVEPQFYIHDENNPDDPLVIKKYY